MLAYATFILMCNVSSKRLMRRLRPQGNHRHQLRTPSN